MINPDIDVYVLSDNITNANGPTETPQGNPLCGCHIFPSSW